MSRGRGLLSEISWFQVAASVLAAVTSAFVASRLGVAGTLIGAALGSFVVTISSAFYGRTLQHGRTLLIQTERGTTIERHVDEGEVQSALNEAEDLDSPARSARFVDEDRGLPWKRILATTVLVLALALAAISAYELVSGRTLDGSGGTTIGDTFGGSREPKDPAPTETTPPTATATATATDTPTPTGSATTPTPTATKVPTDLPTSAVTPPPE